MVSTDSADLRRDLIASVVVYLVALPLCLGIALASGAPLASGLIAGILGGLVVGWLSGSHTSVSGPAAGLASVVAVQIGQLGSFSAFLVALVIAGALQMAMGLAKVGFIVGFFPTAVVKGLLAAIGVLLVIKQIPHVLGHDNDAEGEMSFQQPDGENSFSELVLAFGDIQPGAALIGITAIAILMLWSKVSVLDKSGIPAPLVVVAFGVVVNELLVVMGSAWEVAGTHLVNVPVTTSVAEVSNFFATPDWSVLSNPAVYVAAFTLALVASLETLLNLNAVDQIDPQQRTSPPDRELVAQGAANVLGGLIGGIPVTSVIVRSSVNIHAGATSKRSAVAHGALLLISVATIPWLLNRIPLSALAAILLVTGFKLASPSLFRKMWQEGIAQFLPFVVTVVMIVLTDLLIGVLIGLAVAIAMILRTSHRRPLRQFREHHLAGDLLRIELSEQVTFLHRARLMEVLNAQPAGTRLVLDARRAHSIDPDVLDLIEDFRDRGAKAHGVELSLLGFQDHYPQIMDDIHFVDFATREVQVGASPKDVLDVLVRGNERFRSGQLLTRDFQRQVDGTAAGQSPLAVVLSCIDSRAPAELLFDLGIGEIFNARIAGNVTSDKVLGSVEYATKVAGSKLIVVLGHTACGAVAASVDLRVRNLSAKEATGCENLGSLVVDVQACFPTPFLAPPPGPERDAFNDAIAERNVRHTMRMLVERSPTINELVQSKQVGLVGAIYDVRSGEVRFIAGELVEAAAA